MDLETRSVSLATARALGARDRTALAAATPLLSLVIDLFGTADPRDLWTACARLGAVLAEADATPSFAATVLDAAVEAFTSAGHTLDSTRIGPARASVVEGFVAAVRDALQAETRASWEPPAAIVALGEGRYTVACGYPDGDPERRAAWAERVAGSLSKRGAREVVVGGRSDEVTEALASVGVRVVTGLTAGFRWPWQRAPKP